MTAIVLSLLVTLGQTSTEGSAAATECPTVPHLVLDVELGEDHVIRGTAEWTWANREPAALDELQFVLLANAEEVQNPELSNLANAQGYFNAWESGTTDLGEVQVAGAPAPWAYVAAKPIMQTYSLERLYASVRLPAPLAPGACVTVTMPFATKVPHRIGDAGHYNGDTTYRFGWFPMPRHRDRGGWSDGYVLTGFTHVTRFKAPEGQTVVLGGERLRREGEHFLARADVPVRSVPFVASSRLTRHAKKIDGIKVNVYTYSDAAIFDTSNGEAEEKLEQLEQILPFFRSHFGPLRYETLQVIESPLSNVGMAADGFVLLGDITFIYDRSWVAWGLFGPVGELTLAHEVGHQWWGIGVGSDFDPENWISESMAQQMMFTYSRARFGVDGVDYLSPNWFVKWLIANFLGVPLPTNMLNHEVQPSYTDHLRFGVDGKVVGPVREREHAEESTYLVYQKGYLAVRGLAALLGTSGLEATMRAVYADHAGDVITTEDVVAAALDVTGVDVGPYFAGFMKGLARADLSVAGVVTTPTDTGFHTVVTVERDGDFVLPAKVQLETVDETQEVTWGAAGASRDFVFDTEEPPTVVVVDPDGLIPDPNRVNNRWPEKTRFEWFAPQRNPDATTFSFNPLPIHRYYTAGLSFGGVDYEGNRLWTGLGLSGLGVDSKNDRNPYYAVQGTAYGEVAVPSGRAAQLSALVLGTWRRDRDNGNYGTARLTLAHIAGLYESIDIGAPGQWALPRTVVTTELGVGAVGIPGAETEWRDRHVKDGEVLNEGAVPVVRLALLRDESLKYGATAELAVAGGTNRHFDRGYGVGELGATYAVVIPYVGELDLLGHGYAGTQNLDPLFGRPGLRALPMTFGSGDNPYDMIMEGGASLRLPILRDLRVKNELTLGLLVWNDLFLELHYGAARGTAWTPGKNPELSRWENRGEVGAGVGLGFGFLTIPFRLTLGVGVPTWPSATDFDERAFFMQLGT